MTQEQTPKARSVALKDLTIDKGIQPRDGTDEATVADYAAAIEAGATMPPAVVFDAGASLYLAGGFQRHAAHLQLGKRSIACLIYKGTYEDAWIFARGDNKHGKHFTNDEKNRIVREMLENDVTGKWSDRRIALHVGVSAMFVGKVRATLTVNGLQSDERVGADGRAINTANIGASTREEAPPDAPKLERGDGVRFTDPMTGDDVIGNYLYCASGKHIVEDIHGQQYRVLKVELVEGDGNFFKQPDADVDNPVESADSSEQPPTSPPESTFEPGDEVEGTDNQGVGIRGTIVKSYLPLGSRIRYLVKDSAGTRICFAQDLSLLVDEDDTDETDDPETDAPAAPSTTETPPPLTTKERIEAMQMYQSLHLHAHAGRLFFDQAELWIDNEKLFKSAHAKLAHARYMTGEVSDALHLFGSIPAPESWEGCAACKGTLRVGERADPCPRCKKGGFTTHKGQGVSADVVAAAANPE
jgi:transposase-like protein